jgi:general secretion pathway protein L
LEEELSEKLILRLSSQSSSCIPWLVWSQTTKEVIVSGQLDHQDNISVLTEYAKGRHVTVLVDSADVRLHRHFMPRKPTRQLLKALPFMLEDELAEDIEHLHFAIEETGYDKKLEQYWVNIAIVKRSLLQRWLTLLAEANIQVKSMLPDVLCLPDLSHQFGEESKSISILEYANGWLIRESNWGGLFLTDPWLPMYFEKLIPALKQDGADSQNTVSAIEVNYFSPLPADLTASLIESEQVNLSAADQELPMLLLAQQAESLKWNLLQGDFAQKKAVSKNWSLWRPAAILLCITLSIQFVMTITKWQSAAHGLDVAKQELTQMYQSAFPKEKLRINILRTQLKRKVAAVGGDTNLDSSGFIELMTKLTVIFKKSPNINLDSIRYDDKRGELRLNASAPSFQQFEQFKTDIEKLGLSVKQGAVNNEGNTVSGSLSIEEAK